MSSQMGEAYTRLYLNGLTPLHQNPDHLGHDYLAYLRIFKSHSDYHGTFRVLINLGDLALFRGDYVQVEGYYASAQSQINMLGTGWASSPIFQKYAEVARKRGELEQAVNYCFASLEIAQQSGDLRRISTVLSNLGELTCMEGECKREAQYHDQAVRLALETGSFPLVLSALVAIARCYASAGDGQHARQLLNTILAHPACGQYTHAVAVGMLKDLEME